MSRRPIIIVLLLLGCLISIGILGWQSWRLQESNDAVARSVQRDYANLAADELARRTTAALGYRGYFQVLSRLENPADAMAFRRTLQQDPDIAAAATLVDTVFVVNARKVSIDPESAADELLRLIDSLASRPDIGDGPYRSIAATARVPQVIYARRGNNGTIVGFTVADAGVAAFLQSALDAGPLLPASLGSGQVGNDRLFVEIRDNNDRILLAANSEFPYAEVVEKVMGDEYQGVAQGFRIRIAVDPASSAALLIGGLPSDQLPILALVLILAMALLLAAIWLFRREQAVMQMRVDFVSQVSHELRTPLTQIRMFAETLLLGRTRSADEQRRSLEIIDRESRRLSHLVENILQLSKISDSREVHPELQLIMPVVREVCEATAMMSRNTSIEVLGDDTVTAYIDDEALHQILLNLLDNSIKYGPAEQTVTVQVSRRQNVSRIEVMDQGSGIPNDEYDRVWDAFYRPAREAETAISGTGIGLAVVRELVEAMQGRCWFEKSLGGAHVVVELRGAEHDA